MSSPARRLAELGISSNKALGQHFLHDRSVVQRICDVAGIGSNTTVLEVGPGLGILTEELARRARRVIALEKDATLAAALSGLGLTNLAISNEDALTFDVSTLCGTPYSLVANLPYNVATAILRRFLDSINPPSSVTFMVQREVAERMVARPPSMNILAVAMEFHGAPRIAFNIGRGAFTPPPRVTSSVVHMPVEHRYELAQQNLQEFFDLVRAGFSARRKQLKNSLENGGFSAQLVAAMLSMAGIDPSVRPQQLDVGDWVTIFDSWRKLQASDEQ